MKATSNKAWTIFSAPSRQIWVWGQNKIAFFSGNCFFSSGSLVSFIQGPFANRRSTLFKQWEIHDRPVFLYVVVD